MTKYAASILVALVALLGTFSLARTHQFAEASPDPSPAPVNEAKPSKPKTATFALG